MLGINVGRAMAQTAARQFLRNVLPDCNASIASDCARLNGNSRRNCEYGPIFDPLRPDLKERLGALVGMTHQASASRIVSKRWNRAVLDRAMFAQGLLAMQRAITTAVFAIFMLPAGIAHAQFLFGPQHTFWPGQYAPYKHKHHHRQTNSETAPEPLPKGPLQIIISIADQRVSLFDNGALIARSSVSTGMEGHPTPLGVFSVISKERWHRSNIYSAAPMPYMQRITWSGIALHAGVVPGHPASHGCIRLKNDFAVRLWHLTKRGTRVIIAHGDVQPVEITNPHLFQAESRLRFVAITESHRRTKSIDQPQHRRDRRCPTPRLGNRQSPGAGLGPRWKRAQEDRSDLRLRESQVGQAVRAPGLHAVVRCPGQDRKSGGAAGNTRVYRNGIPERGNGDSLDRRVYFRRHFLACRGATKAARRPRSRPRYRYRRPIRPTLSSTASKYPRIRLRGFLNFYDAGLFIDHFERI